MSVLINHNKPIYRTFAEQYRLFHDWTKAISEAKALGWKDPFGMGINHKTGMANQYMCGDVNLTLMAIEEE